jgi:hypothetical protein
MRSASLFAPFANGSFDRGHARVRVSVLLVTGRTMLPVVCQPSLISASEGTICALAGCGVCSGGRFRAMRRRGQ